MTAPDFYNSVLAHAKTMKYGDKINLRNIFKNYKESVAAKYMKGSNIKILVNLGLGKNKFKAYTCDLTHEYISINADYRN